MKQYFCLLMMALSAVSAYAGGDSVSYEVKGKEFQGYYVSPSADAPLVIIVHDWDGVTDYEVKRASMLAKEGYAVFLLDMFGKGVRPKETAEKRKLTGALYADRERMRTLFNAGLAAAKKQGANVSNAIAMGYCFGGTVVLEAARAGVEAKGFVGFHAGLAIPEGQDYSKARSKVTIFHGTADKVVSMEEFAKLGVALESAGLPHEMITYGGAPHAFSVFGSERYRKDADEQSWSRFLKLLKETLQAK
jgi:dienelactone hydrolase